MTASNAAELKPGHSGGNPFSPIVVTTRFGLGQSRDTYYQQALPLLLNVLAPSIRGQTEKEFIWLLLCDARCPSIVRHALSELRSEVPQLVVVFHDAFETFRLLPDLATLLSSRLGLAQDVYTVTVRVDSDDALAIDYIEGLRLDAQRVLNLHGARNAGFVSPSGSVLYLKSGKAFRFIKRNYSVLAVGSSNGPSFVHCYSFPHTVVGTPASGLLVRELSSSEPLWLRVVGPGAEHRSAKKNHLSFMVDLFPTARALASKANFRHASSQETFLGKVVLETLDRRFGLRFSETGFLVAAQRFRKSEIPKYIKVAYGRGRKRMGLKNRILEQAAKDHPINGTEAGRQLWLGKWTKDFYAF